MDGIVRMLSRVSALVMYDKGCMIIVYRWLMSYAPLLEPSSLPFQTLVSSIFFSITVLSSSRFCHSLPRLRTASFPTLMAGPLHQAPAWSWMRISLKYSLLLHLRSFPPAVQRPSPVLHHSRRSIAAPLTEFISSAYSGKVLSLFRPDHSIRSAPRESPGPAPSRRLLRLPRIWALFPSAPSPPP